MPAAVQKRGRAGGTRSRAGVGGSAGFVCRWGDTPVDDERRSAGAAHTCAMCCPGDTACEATVPPVCTLCSSVPARIIRLVTTRRMAHSAPGRTTMASASRAAVPHDASEEFRRCLRERVRLARELAALRAGFATVAEHYERVLRTLQALGLGLGINPKDIGHATDPDWGPATLLVYGDERFLKHEQAVVELLLRRLP